MPRSRASRSRRARVGPARTVSRWPVWQWSRRILLGLLAAPLALQIVLGAVAVLLVWLTVNWVYQVIRKPTEVFFPVSAAMAKRPPETWRRYAPLFHKHSTEVITPPFLASLAQVEGGGNPLARTYWRWQPAWNPLAVYRPASSAVGMYQITNATFEEAKRYCIHDHTVVEAGPWHDVRSCWFNGLYTRVVPSHAIELTAALLDRQVAQTIGSRSGATTQRKQDLAAIIHLCGPSAGQAYVSRGFRLVPRQRCGD